MKAPVCWLGSVKPGASDGFGVIKIVQTKNECPRRPRSGVRQTSLSKGSFWPAPPPKFSSLSGAAKHNAAYKLLKVFIFLFRLTYYDDRIQQTKKCVGFFGSKQNAELFRPFVFVSMKIKVHFFECTSELPKHLSK